MCVCVCVSCEHRYVNVSFSDFAELMHLSVILLHVTQLLDSVGSVDTVRSVLKHILDLVSFSVPFPKLSKTLLKVGISIVAEHFFTSKCTGIHYGVD